MTIIKQNDDDERRYAAQIKKYNKIIKGKNNATKQIL